MEEESRLRRWLLVSILVHLLLVPIVRQLPRMRIEVEPPKFVDIDLAAPPPPPKRVEPPRAAPPAVAAPPKSEPVIPIPDRQIVTPPDAGEEKAPKDTRLLSDRDNTVPEQSVRRAPQPRPVEVPAKEDAPKEARAKAAVEQKPDRVAPPRPEGARNPGPRPAEPAPRRPETRVASLPKLDQLLPGGDFAAVAKQVAREPAPAAVPAAPAERRREFLGEQGPAFAMRPGVSDFLPAIRESNITLLNTKAERFAPFVRRVAGRVFQHLDIRLRQSVRGTAVSSGREYALVEAVMSRQGRLVGAKLLERQSLSGLAADRILLSVTEPETFFDANPPAGAEGNDGNIHFVLLIDLQVLGVQDPRTGRVSAGYQGIAGVGLDAAPKRPSSDDG